MGGGGQGTLQGDSPVTVPRRETSLHRGDVTAVKRTGDRPTYRIGRGED